MDLWFAVAAPIAVAAFLGWYIWGQRRRRGRARRDAMDDPRDTWDALSAGEDPTVDDR